MGGFMCEWTCWQKVLTKYEQLQNFPLKLKWHMLSCQAYCYYCFSSALARRQFVKRVCNLFCVSYLLLCNCVKKMFLLKSISLLPITYRNMVGYRTGWPSTSNISLKMVAALRKMVENTTAIPMPAITTATPNRLPLPLEKGLSTNSYLNLKATRSD